MIIGRVKWYSKENGYGIIMPDDGNRDIYVGKDDVMKAGMKYLSNGQSISYQIGISLHDRVIAQNIKAIQ
jgi:CspA family cold shock protein